MNSWSRALPLVFAFVLPAAAAAAQQLPAQTYACAD